MTIDDEDRASYARVWGKNKTLTPWRLGRAILMGMYSPVRSCINAIRDDYDAGFKPNGEPRYFVRDRFDEIEVDRDEWARVGAAYQAMKDDP